MAENHLKRNISFGWKITTKKYNMNKAFYKILAFIFGLGAIGGMSESYRIMTSSAPDIAPQRTYLTIMALGMLVLFLFLTRYFWRKGKN